MRWALLLFLGLFCSDIALAQRMKGVRLHVALSLGLGYGTFQSANGTTVTSRANSIYGLGGEFGAAYRQIIFGASGNYRWQQQIREPAELGNQNTQGVEFAWGPFLGFRFRSFTLVAKYILRSELALDQPNRQNQRVSYLDPEQSFAISLRTQLGKRRKRIPFIGLEYRRLTYDSTRIAGVKSALSTNTKMESASYGIVGGIVF